jgi:hypothetical protein
MTTKDFRPHRRALLLGLFAGLALPIRGLASDASVRIEVVYGVVLTPEQHAAQADWAIKLEAMIVGWWPAITSAFAWPGYVAPDVVTVEFARITPTTISGVTLGTKILVNAPMILDHLHNPDLDGMVAHELAHVVQACPQKTRANGWLVEGMADYIRYYVLLPDDPARGFDGTHFDWRFGYQPTAALLDWIERQKPGTIRKVNAVIRAGGDSPQALIEAAGGNLDIPWRAYLATHPPAATPAANRTRLEEQGRP